MWASSGSPALYLNDALAAAGLEPAAYRKYVDDIVLTEQGEEHAQRLAERFLVAKQALEASGMKLNLQKTVAICEG